MNSSNTTIQNGHKHTVGDNIDAPNASWNFGGDVPLHFDDHVSRSVPLYHEGHDLIIKLSDFFVSNRSVVYDIGCSTGKLVKDLAYHNREKDLKIIGIDVEASMAERAREVTSGIKNIEIIAGDVLDVELKKADLIISYFTVQFIRPRVRQLVINKIYESLNWGGAFIFFEKVRACDARFQDIMSSLYVDYKIDRGYHPEEIVSKARSLKGVLEPFSTQGNIDMLKRAGFVDIMSVMKYVSFEGFLAIK
jgi:tRNA (cmo5U34)-methyltransferase